MKYIALLIILLSSSLALAQPRGCPAVSLIQSVGLSTHLVRDATGKWYAGRTAQSYGTEDFWTFAIGGISASTQDQALSIAYNAIASLKFVSGPNKAPAEKWLCLYSNNANIPAGAISPPINNYLINY